MTDDDFVQIGVILERHDSFARKSVGERIARYKAGQAKMGTLGSSRRWLGEVDILKDQIGEFLAACMEDVALISANTEAYSLIEGAVAKLIQDLQVEFKENFNRANNLRPLPATSVQLPSYLKGMKEHFDQELRFCRIKFTKAGSHQAAKLATDVSGHSSPTSKNRGGKPLASHWDAMWADIATLLWNGDLKPATQADIKQAMFDWFGKAEIEVGDTAMTERARALWQRMQASK
jgi:hypothetical protein